MAEVAEQPPEAGRPTGPLVVADDEGAGADPGARCPGGECLGGRQRVAPADCAASWFARQVALRVGMGGARNVSGEIRVLGAAVHEAVLLHNTHLCGYYAI